MATVNASAPTSRRWRAASPAIILGDGPAYSAITDLEPEAATRETTAALSLASVSFFLPTFMARRCRDPGSGILIVRPNRTIQRQVLLCVSALALFDAAVTVGGWVPSPPPSTFPPVRLFTPTRARAREREKKETGALFLNLPPCHDAPYGALVLGPRGTRFDAKGQTKRGPPWCCQNRGGVCVCHRVCVWGGVPPLATWGVDFRCCIICQSPAGPSGRRNGLKLSVAMPRVFRLMNFALPVPAASWPTARTTATAVRTAATSRRAVGADIVTAQPRLAWPLPPRMPFDAAVTRGSAAGTKRPIARGPHRTQVGPGAARTA